MTTLLHDLRAALSAAYRASLPARRCLWRRAARVDPVEALRSE